MADPAPLLADSNESETPKLEKHEASSLDETIERCFSNSGLTQFFQAILVSFAWAFDAQQTFITVFTDAEPTRHCTPLTDHSCNSSAIGDLCHIPRTAWAWDMPAERTIISEWSLECASSIIAGLPTSSFFTGCLVGGLVLATLADSTVGRKNMLLLSSLLMSIAGIFTAAATNIWMYSILRFICGFGRATIGTCALVLSTEIVGKKWRGQVGIIGFLCFTMGFLSLPAIAYLNRGSSWRVMYLWTCIPALVYCILVHFLVHESPRWLFVRGRKEEFVATLRSIAPKATSSSLTLSFSGTSTVELSPDFSLYSAIKILLQKSWAFRRLAAVMGVGFGIGMVYYGMPLAVGSLPINLYWSVTLNALSELPSSLVTFLLIEKLNRRSSLMGFTTLSGICSLMCALLRSERVELLVGLELVSFFSACTAFNLLLIYTLELFPTCVRNSAVSMVRQGLVLGGVFSPVLVVAGRKNGWLSYGVFGLTIGLCGLFAASLQETRGCTLCDTIDEQERESRNFTGVDYCV